MTITKFSKYLNYLLILLLAVNMYTSYAQDNMDALWANVTAFALLLALIGKEKELEEQKPSISEKCCGGNCGCN